MAKYILPDGAGEIEVIAGTYKDKTGPATTFSPVNMQNARLNKGGKTEFSFPENYNTVLLVIEGSVKVNGEEDVPTDHLVLFENDGETFTVEAHENSVVLVLSGEPFHEPIAAHGPFVMNTRRKSWKR